MERPGVMRITWRIGVVPIQMKRPELVGSYTGLAVVREDCRAKWWGCFVSLANFGFQPLVSGESSGGLSPWFKLRNNMVGLAFCPW